MTDYEIAVRLLGSRDTHLKLRDRVRRALSRLKQGSRPLPPDFLQRVQTAVYRRENAVAYKQRHFPGWDDLPREMTKPLEDRYPLSGHGMAQLNTMLGLHKMAEEAEADLSPEPAPDATEVEVDQMIQDYLDYRAS